MKAGGEGGGCSAAPAPLFVHFECRRPCHCLQFGVNCLYWQTRTDSRIIGCVEKTTLTMMDYLKLLNRYENILTGFTFRHLS